jgi:MoxR-like ATPase
MNQGRIIVITGAPGTGKTTTASVVAKESDLEKSVHMHTDVIVDGIVGPWFLEPWLNIVQEHYEVH